MRRLVIAAVLSAACAHVQPEALTVEEHRAEASRHHEEARRERAQYDSAPAMRPPSRALAADAEAERLSTYNPPAEHLAAADDELRAAAQHLAAARQLESFEHQACRDIAPSVRAACPLLASSVLQVRNTAAGLELQLTSRADGVEIHRNLRCHLAYAEANGFAKPSCPLFVKGMTLRLVSPSVLELSGSTLPVVKELQAQAHRLFAGEAPSPAAGALVR